MKKLLGETLVEKKVITAEQLKQGLESSKKDGGTLGQALVRLNFVSRVKMEQELIAYYGAAWLVQEGMKKVKRFGETLIEKGVITEQQLKEGLSNQKVTGRTLGETLVRIGFVKREEMNKHLMDYYGVPWLK